MNIMLFLCKSLNIIALTFIATIFICKLYSKVPDDTKQFSIKLFSKPVISSSYSAMCDKKPYVLSKDIITTCITDKDVKRNTSIT